MRVEVDGAGQGLIRSSRSCSLGAAPNMLRSALQFLSSKASPSMAYLGSFLSVLHLFILVLRWSFHQSDHRAVTGAAEPDRNSSFLSA